MVHGFHDQLIDLLPLLFIAGDDIGKAVVQPITIESQVQLFLI